MWTCIVAGGALLLIRFWAGVVMFLAAAWYGYALHWMNAHDGWRQVDQTRVIKSRFDPN